MTVHIWARPVERDNDIFHCHPPEQEIPKPKKLVDWYKKMLDKAKSDEVVFDYRVSSTLDSVTVEAAVNWGKLLATGGVWVIVG